MVSQVSAVKRHLRGVETAARVCLRCVVSAQANVKTEIAAMIDRKDFGALKKFLEPWLPADLAPIISELPMELLAVLFRVAAPHLAGATVPHLHPRAQHQ